MRPDPSYEEYLARFAALYDKSNYDAGLSGKMLQMSHAWCEHPFDASLKFSRVLEVGAGTGMHVKYVRHDFDEYVMTDMHTAMLQQAASKQELRGRGIRVEEQDATRLTYSDAQFDRLIATHVLEHLPEPHKVLREWERVVRKGGILSLILPCDPGVAWRLGRRLGSRATFEKAGIAYDYWMSREHINPINNLVAFIRYYFPDSRVESWRPFHVPSMDLNLFYIVHIRKP